MLEQKVPVKKPKHRVRNIGDLFDTCIIERTLSDDERRAIRFGHQPMEMEDKWLMYCEEDILYVHRSWTGICIYVIDLRDPAKLYVKVNRNPEEYRETSLEKDKKIAEMMLDSLIIEHIRDI